MRMSLSISIILLACSLAAWGQDQQSLGDAARENQEKKASRVIDNDNIGSAISNSNGVQDASARTESSASDGADAKDAAAAPTAKEEDSAKHRLEVLKEKEANWVKTIDLANKKLETATGMAHDMWVRNLATAQEGLSDTRAKIPEAEAAAKAEEAQQQQAPATPSEGAAHQ